MEEKQPNVKPPKKSSGQRWAIGITSGIFLGVVLGSALDDYGEGMAIGLVLGIGFPFVFGGKERKDDAAEQP